MHSESLITQVQLALVGIILVIGLFFLWRAVGRIEEKLEKVACSCVQNSNNNVCRRETPSNIEEDNAFAEKLMQDVFNSQQGGFVFVNPVTTVFEEEPEQENTMEIEEVEESEEVTVVEPEPETVPETVVEPEHETESDANPLSKTKLGKMNVSELQELCRQRGLNVEGAKKVLVDRLLGLTRE